MSKKNKDDQARGGAMGEGSHSPTAMETPAGSAHAKTPWHIAHHKYELYIVGGDYLGQGSVICDVRMYPGADHAESVANAEFICRAVNCHDELVAALKGLMWDTQTGTKCFCLTEPSRVGYHAARCDFAMAALAKATQKG